MQEVSFTEIPSDVELTISFEISKGMYVWWRVEQNMFKAFLPKQWQKAVYNYVEERQNRLFAED